MYCLANLLFFDISLSYDTRIADKITLVILSAILLPIKSPVASAVELLFLKQFLLHLL